MAVDAKRTHKNGIPVVDLTSEDIRTIKKARVNDLGIYIMMIFASLFFFFFILLGSKKPEFFEDGPPPLWISYLVYILSIGLMFNAIKNILYYQIDIIRGYKLVMIANCKKYTESGEGVSHHLIVEDYGKIDLFGYNEECYFSRFSEQEKRYEIHLAPLSKVLLYVRYIHLVPEDGSLSE